MSNQTDDTTKRFTTAMTMFSLASMIGAQDTMARLRMESHEALDAVLDATQRHGEQIRQQAKE